MSSGRTVGSLQMRKALPWKHQIKTLPSNSSVSLQHRNFKAIRLNPLSDPALIKHDNVNELLDNLTSQKMKSLNINERKNKQPLSPLSSRRSLNVPSVKQKLSGSKHISLEEIIPNHEAKTNLPIFSLEASGFLPANAPEGLGYAKERSKIILNTTKRASVGARFSLSTTRNTSDVTKSTRKIPAIDKMKVTRNHTIILPTLSLEDDIELNAAQNVTSKPQFRGMSNLPTNRSDKNVHAIGKLPPVQPADGHPVRSSKCTNDGVKREMKETTDTMSTRRRYSTRPSCTMHAVSIGTKADVCSNVSNSRSNRSSLSERNKVRALSMRKGSLRLSTTSDYAPMAGMNCSLHWTPNIQVFNAPIHNSTQINNMKYPRKPSRTKRRECQPLIADECTNVEWLNEQEVFSRNKQDIMQELRLNSSADLAYPAQPPPTVASPMYQSTDGELDFRSLIEEKRRSMSRYVSPENFSGHTPGMSQASRQKKPVIVVPPHEDMHGSMMNTKPHDKHVGQPVVNIQFDILDHSQAPTTDGSKSSSRCSSLLNIDHVDHDGLASLPTSPRGSKSFLNRRSSSIDSGMSRPGSELLEVPLLTFNAKDRIPLNGESPQESPVVSPTCSVMSEENLPQQVVHRVSCGPVFIPPTPCQSPENGQESQHLTEPQVACHPQVSLTTDDGDDFAVWFGRRGSIFIEEKPGEEKTHAKRGSPSQAPGQLSLLVPKVFNG